MKYDLSRPNWEIFHSQFFFTRESVQPGEHWNHVRFGDWHLHLHADLPVFKITSKDGNPIGMLIGHCVSGSGKYIASDLQFDVNVEAPDFLASMESALYELAGRWIFVLWTPQIRRLYLDPCGTLAAVYNKETQTFASTTTIINILEDRHQDNLGNPVYHYRKTGFQYGDLTPFERMRRVLPNHYLDLDSFETVRHHYTSLPGRVSEKEREPLRTDLCTITRRTIQAFAEVLPIKCTLTGGRDSRFLVSCCRPFLDRTEFLTFRFDNPHRNNPIDQRYPKILADRFNLNHRYVDSPRIDDYTSQIYQMRIGFSSGAGLAGSFCVGLTNSVDLNCALLTGFGGVARAYWWDRYRRINKPPSPEIFLRTLHGGKLMTPRNIEAIERLISDVDWDDPLDLLDVLHIEQRTGCWSSPMMYGWARVTANIDPFAHRGIMDARLRYPKSVIDRTTMMVDGTNALWPELSELPYNAYTGIRETRRQMPRKFRQLKKRIWRKIERYL